jgi:hypothetical protein
VVGDTIASQPVTISIRKGGGTCQDESLARIGSLSWVKAVTTGPNPSTSTTLESLQATLVEAPANQLQPPTSGAPSAVYPSDTIQAAPNCPGSAGRRLNAGSLTVQGGTGSPLMFSPSAVSGELIYQATLAAGTIQPGTVHLSAAGGADIGPFHADLSLPPPIQITTLLPPGAKIATNKPFRLDWTNGTSDVIVHVFLGSPVLGVYEYFGTSAAGDQGSVTLNPVDPPNMISFPIPTNNSAVVDVLVTPMQPQAFTAPTLARSGTQNWTYEFKFTGLQWAAQ